jgi:hypothetical protein
MVYVPPGSTTTSGSGTSGISGNIYANSLLVTKKYVDDLFNSISNS